VEVEARAKTIAEAAKKNSEPIPDPGNRVALVIGNSAYRSVAALPNPARDALAMAAMFRAASFNDVTVETNIGVAAMRRALLDLNVSAAAAALATTVSTWLALLIVTGALVLLAGLLGAIGVSRLRKGTPLIPVQAIEEAKLTTEALKNGRH